MQASAVVVLVRVPLHSAPTCTSCSMVATARRGIMSLACTTLTQ